MTPPRPPTQTCEITGFRTPVPQTRTRLRPDFGPRYTWTYRDTDGPRTPSGPRIQTPLRLNISNPDVPDRGVIHTNLGDVCPRTDFRSRCPRSKYGLWYPRSELDSSHLRLDHDPTRSSDPDVSGRTSVPDTHNRTFDSDVRVEPQYLRPRSHRDPDRISDPDTHDRTSNSVTPDRTSDPHTHDRVTTTDSSRHF